MRRWICILALPIFAADPLPEDRGAAGLWHALTQLQTTARVLHIAAHPDDEDGPVLTLLARGRGAHVTMLSLTRGESGANLITGDFFDRLGALRTAEFLRAAQYYGTEVRFTRAVDYGYSKNVAETFKQWNRREVLADIVRVIRTVKPHVILSRWSGTPRDGHGNHEAAGILAQEAFAAAADPAFVTAGLPPWRTVKIYTGNRNALDESNLKIATGIVDPLLGRTYSQFAREGLRWQRSQGAGAASARPGAAYSYYQLTSSRVATNDKETSFFDRIDTSLNELPELARHIDAAVKSFRINDLKACAPHLAAALRAIRDRDEAHPALAAKREQLNRALALSLGVQLVARVQPQVLPSGPFSAFRPAETFSVAVPGQSFNVDISLDGAEIENVEFLGSFETRQLQPNLFRIAVPANAPPTTVQWHRDNIRQTAYDIDKAAPFDAPTVPNPLRVRVTYKEGGQIEAPVLVSPLDTLGVERLKPLAVGPPIAIQFASEAGILPLAANTYSVQLTVSNNVDGPANGAVRLTLPAGWSAAPPQLPFAFTKEKEQAVLRFTLHAPANRPAGDAPIQAIASYNGKDYAASFDEITQPGLASLYVSKPARHLIRSIDVRVKPNRKVAYVMGTGDDVPEALRQLGVPVDLLDTNAIGSANLSAYTTILLGIRAYAVRPDVRTHNQRLLDFVANGGTLIVQYNTPEFDKNYGPYPYSMGRNPEEVSEEDSPVALLDPSHSVFHSPNTITTADFNGWVEQRGSKFLTSWDSRYQALLETHDSGQPPQKGGWLVARHGKGLYIYCAYAWYRQLPYAVPGAVRLFANLISQ
ncbi:MAG TPA: PIG-L family deacetylase [Bryobacteraceae bacterium]|nr:PIG-L family deacetylase [Bryobacteraceae bacterium]